MALHWFPRQKSSKAQCNHALCEVQQGDLKKICTCPQVCGMSPAGQVKSNCCSPYQCFSRHGRALYAITGVTLASVKEFMLAKVQESSFPLWERLCWIYGETSISRWRKTKSSSLCSWFGKYTLQPSWQTSLLSVPWRNPMIRSLTQAVICSTKPKVCWCCLVV